MKMSILVEKLWMENKEFVTVKELKEYCKMLKLKHESVIHYLLKRKHLVRIFKGIYYIKSLEEFELGKTKYNHLELVAKGLELKGVKNWYFGLHTALKHNNMTHEYFTIDEVISDSIFRANPVNIVGYKFKFIKLTPPLIKFGIKSKGLLRYSDPEKTILDFVYLSLQEGMPSNRISMDVGDWAKDISENKLNKYVIKYPKTVAKTVEMIIK
jgi:predicted transcriptional regulator of viral defense system